MKVQEMVFVLLAKLYNLGSNIMEPVNYLDTLNIFRINLAIRPEGGFPIPEPSSSRPSVNQNTWE